MKDLGPVTWYISMQITKDQQSCKIFADQKTYINQLIFSLNIKSCKPIKTSIILRIKIKKNRHIKRSYPTTMCEI